MRILGSAGRLFVGHWPALLTLGLFSYPYLYLLLVAGMKNLDPLLEEAGHLRPAGDGEPAGAALGWGR